jgi:hypothetical protein
VEGEMDTCRCGIPWAYHGYSCGEDRRVPPPPPVCVVDDEIASLRAALAAAERENTEHKERFARAAGALGAEMGKRERAEVERDWLLAKLVYPYAGGWRVNAVTHSTPSDAVQSIIAGSANDKEIRGIFDKLRAAAALPGEGSESKND